jgi:diaminopimelate epimerase
MTALRVVKGHGTENDFVLFTDPDGAVALTPELARALCDRRAGIGGDGVIRAVRTAALVEAGDVAPSEGLAVAEWFMDYRNADGSLAEMCGNGVRVFVAHLIREGFLALADGADVAVGTRAGVKRVRREGDWFAADLGPWFVLDEETSVGVPGEPAGLPGIGVDVGNPHVVVALPDAAALAAADLHRPPRLDPAPPNGANVELIVPLPTPDLDGDGTGDIGRLAMRVHERGSGETRSCGTGTVAAVIAARVWGGDLAPDEWLVDVPGGRLRVRIQPGAVRSGLHAELAGPAVIVAEATVDLTALPLAPAAVPASG